MTGTHSHRPVFTICLPSKNLSGICKEQRWIEESCTKCEEGGANKTVNHMCTVGLPGTDKNRLPTLDHLSGIRDLRLPTWGMEIITGSLTGYKHPPTLLVVRVMASSLLMVTQVIRVETGRRTMLCRGEGRLICSGASWGWGWCVSVILKTSKEALRL